MRSRPGSDRRCGFDRTAGDRLEALIVQFAPVPAGVRLKRIIETKGRTEACDIEAVAARLVQRMSRAQQTHIGSADGRSRRYEQ